MRSETREFNIEALNKPIRTFIYCFVVGAIIYIEPSRTPGGAKLKRNFLKMKRRKTLAITQKEIKNTRGRTYFFFLFFGSMFARQYRSAPFLRRTNAPQQQLPPVRPSKGQGRTRSKNICMQWHPGNRLTATRRGSSHLPPPLAVAADKLTSERVLKQGKP